jgi:hypothetical protein
VLKLAWNMILTDSVNQLNKLQALSLISDCYRHQMDLSTNAGVIEQAMRFVPQKKEQLENTFHHNNNNNNNKEAEPETRDNTVF